MFSIVGDKTDKYFNLFSIAGAFFSFFFVMESDFIISSEIEREEKDFFFLSFYVIASTPTQN